MNEVQTDPATNRNSALALFKWIKNGKILFDTSTVYKMFYKIKFSFKYMSLLTKINIWALFYFL
jgi:hypothetical protein